LITCDHATARVPAALNGGDLGVPAVDMRRHIAYDIGARGVALALADRLGAAALCANFSRLVIDPNRAEDDPTLIMRLSDGTLIPANKTLDAAAERQRKSAYYHPYHRALARLAAARRDCILVAIHSFTPRMRHGSLRPWHVGILHAGAQDPRNFGLPLIAQLRAKGDVTVGDNVPYRGSQPGDGSSLDRHGLQAGRPHTIIELRQDLITDRQGQHAWAARLAHALEATLAQTGF